MLCRFSQVFYESGLKSLFAAQLFVVRDFKILINNKLSRQLSGPEKILSALPAAGGIDFDENSSL